MSPHFVKSVSGSASLGTTTSVSIHRAVRLQQDQRVRGLQHADRWRGLNCYFLLTEGMDAGNRHVADTHQYISGLCRLRPDTDPFLERSHLLYLERCERVVEYEPTRALRVGYRVARPTLRRQCAAGQCSNRPNSRSGDFSRTPSVADPDGCFGLPRAFGNCRFGCRRSSLNNLDNEFFANSEENGFCAKPEVPRRRFRKQLQPAQADRSESPFCEVEFDGHFLSKSTWEVSQFENRHHGQAELPLPSTASKRWT